MSAWSFSALTAGFFAYLAVVWIVDGVSALAAGYHAGWRLKGVELSGDERGAAPGGYQKRRVRVTRSQSDASSNV